MSTDNGWLDRMIEQTPAAEHALPAGTVFAPHDGQETDVNYLGADLLAEPDTASDPTRIAGRT